MALTSASPSADPAAAAEFASRFDCWFADQREQAAVIARAFPQLADAIGGSVDEAVEGIAALARELGARREALDAARTRGGEAEAHAFDFPDEHVTTPAAGGPIPEPPLPLPGELMEDLRDPQPGDGTESLGRALLPLAFGGLRAELREIFEDSAAAEILARGVEVEAGLRDGSDPAALERDLASSKFEPLARDAWRARFLETVRALVPAAIPLTDDELAPAADGLLVTARARARHVLYGEPSEVPGPPAGEGGASVATGTTGPAPLESRDYASFLERGIALFIDFFGFWTFGGVALQWVAPAAAEGLQLPAMRIFQWLIFGLWMTAIQLLTGRTPGKALLGLKVLEDGRHHTDWRVRIAVREVFGRLINGLLLGAGYWVSLGDAHRRTWGDRMASTVVLRRPGALPVRLAGAAFAVLALAIQALGWWYITQQDPTVDPLAISDEVQRRVERLESDWAEAESLFVLPYEDLEEFRGRMHAALAPLDRCQAGLDALGWVIHGLPRDPAPIEWFAGRPLQRFERYLGLRRQAVAKQRAAATFALSCAESDLDRCMELWGYDATDADALWKESVRALNGDLR